MSTLARLAFWRRPARDETGDEAWQSTLPMPLPRQCGGVRQVGDGFDKMCTTCRHHIPQHDKGVVLFVPSRVRAVWDQTGTAELECADRWPAWNADR